MYSTLQYKDTIANSTKAVYKKDEWTNLKLNCTKLVEKGTIANSVEAFYENYE